MWLGILADWSLGDPGHLLAQRYARRWPADARPRAPRLAGVRVAVARGLARIFYIPGAVNLRQYRATAILSVLARPPGVLFFLWLWPNLYPTFGYLDLTFTIIQAPLLFWPCVSSPSTTCEERMSQQPPGHRRSYEPEAVRQRRSRLKRLLVVLAAGARLAGAVGLLLWYKLLREVPTYYADAERSFQVRLDRQRSQRRHPVLDLARAPPRVSRPLARQTAVMRHSAWSSSPANGRGTAGWAARCRSGSPKRRSAFRAVAMNCAFCHATMVREARRGQPRRSYRQGRRTSSTRRPIFAFCPNVPMTSGSRRTSCSKR